MMGRLIFNTMVLVSLVVGLWGLMQWGVVAAIGLMIGTIIFGFGIAFCLGIVVGAAYGQR